MSRAIIDATKRQCTSPNGGVFGASALPRPRGRHSAPRKSKSPLGNDVPLDLGGPLVIVTPILQTYRMNQLEVTRQFT